MESDFDYATLNWDHTNGYTALFATRHFYVGKDRYPVDDIESLIYSMWYVTSVPMVRELEGDAESEGCMLSRCATKGLVLEQMKVCISLKIKSMLNYGKTKFEKYLNFSGKM